MPGVVERTPGALRTDAPGPAGAGVCCSLDFRRLCAVGNRPIVPHAMAAAIRDVGGDGVDPVEGIEETKGGAGAGIGRCGDLSIPSWRRRMLSAASGGRVM